MVNRTARTPRGLDDAVVDRLRSYVAEARFVGELMREATFMTAAHGRRVAPGATADVDPLALHIRQLRAAG